MVIYRRYQMLVLNAPQHICEYFVKIPMQPTHIYREYVCFYFAMISFIVVSLLCVILIFFLEFYIWFGLLGAKCDVKERKHRIQAYSCIYGKANVTNTHASSFRLVLCVHYSIILSLFSFPFTPCHSIYAFLLIHAMLHRNYTHMYTHMHMRSSTVHDDNRCFK